FFIVLWIRDEVSMDRFHEDGDRIYSVMRHSTFGGQVGTTVSMPAPLADEMVQRYPEVENTVLISWDTFMLLTLDDNAFRTNGRWAGRDFFEVFSFPLVRGDPSTVLDVPESIVLTESLAERFFGSDWRSRDDIVGAQIRVDNRIDLTVTGIAENPPMNSTLDFTFVVPIEEYIRRNDWTDSWSNNGLRLWARMMPGTDAAAFNAKFRDIIDEHHDFYESDAFIYPFGQRYLYGDWENAVQSGGRIEYIRIFALVAVFILLIAGINFMNLATARSAQRAREIGVRKTIGATRASLATQFMGESILKAAIAFVIATGIVAALLPSFNTFTQKAVSLGGIGAGGWLFFVGAALVTGLLAGSYPAAYLSGFSVTGVFNRRTTAAGRGSGLRKGLVVLQFGLSIILIVGTITIYRQLDYIRTKDLGIDRENVAVVRLEGGIRDQYEAFKGELLQVDGIRSATTSNNNPLQIGNDTIGVEWDGKDPDDNTLYWNAAVGYDFTETMGIDIAAGRAFSREYPSDTTNYLVNWRAAEAMGMEDPVGQQISFWNVPGTIVGVMDDFHMGSMYNPIRPVIFRLRPENTSTLYVRIDGTRTREALAGLEDVYGRFNPEYPLNVRFMDEEFEESYRSEVVLGTLANVFAFVAIFIACLGLFGLASYTAEQRTREIGIRKVLGATVPHVVGLLSREFLLLVGVAFVVGAPVAFYVMN
ncbi:MAG: FtsX-like permease family protein, partial [Rhodothermales bacterium]|nr:FtsX-like permease family protein [Rhodothermales bacterium]